MRKNHFLALRTRSAILASVNRTALAYVIGSLIVGASYIGATRIWNPTHTRTIRSDVVQGIIVGGVLAFITAHILANAYVTKVNGWITMFGCGVPGNGMLLRAACAYRFPAVNVPQEAMYWTTNVDGAGHDALRSSTTTSCTFRRADFRRTMHSGR